MNFLKSQGQVTSKENERTLLQMKKKNKTSSQKEFF
jgi:hypothetical protein